MKSVVLDRWLTDLRSGMFTQARSALCPTDSDGEPLGFCCLGVLATQHPEWNAREHGGASNLDQTVDYTTSPKDRKKLNVWLGLYDESLKMGDGEDRVQTLLMSLNDGSMDADPDTEKWLTELEIEKTYSYGKAWTFDEIATVIEAMSERGWFRIENNEVEVH